MTRVATLLSLSGCFIYKGGGTVDTGTEPCDSPDCGCTDAATLLVVYRDADRDGAGDPAAPLDSCGPVQGYVRDATDCDDTDPRVRPGEPEVCDGRDNDCAALTPDAGVAFVGAEGGVEDLTDDLAASGPDAPITLLLPFDGTLYVCAGDWHASLNIDANVDVVGVSGSAATSLLGDGLVPGVVVAGPRAVNVSGLTIDGAAPIDANGLLVGGGLACSGGAAVTATDVVVRGTEGAAELLLGSALSVRDGCQLDLTDAEVSGGGALYGGQLYVESAVANVSSTTFTGGYAVAGGSAMVGSFLRYKGYTGADLVASFTCTDCTFEGHSAGFYDDVDDNVGLGGAIAVFGDASVTLHGGRFSDNFAGTGGGAVAVFPTQVGDPNLPVVVIDGVTFERNLGGLDHDDVYIVTDPPVSFAFDETPQTVTCGPTTCD